MGSHRSHSREKRAENYLVKLQQEQTELFPSKVTEHQHRERRGFPVALLASTAAGIFGLGMGFKNTLYCTLGKMFGGCHQIGEQNRKTFVDSINHMNQIQQEGSGVQNATNKKVSY